jgi:hypothetical protein
MRYRLLLALALAVATLLARGASAQGEFGVHPTNSRVFTYMDSDGTGVMTIDFVGPEGFVPGASYIRVFLTQNGNRFFGSGTWVPIGNAQVALTFTLSGGGNFQYATYNFSGTLTTGFGGTSGEGQYFQLGFPEQTSQWSLTPFSGGVGSPP